MVRPIPDPWGWQRIRQAGDRLRLHGVKYASREPVLQDSGLIEHEIWLNRPDKPSIILGRVYEEPEDQVDALGLAVAVVDALNLVLQSD